MAGGSTRSLSGESVGGSCRRAPVALRPVMSSSETSAPPVWPSAGRSLSSASPRARMRRHRAGGRSIPRTCGAFRGADARAHEQASSQLSGEVRFVKACLRDDATAVQPARPPGVVAASVAHALCMARRFFEVAHGVPGEDVEQVARTVEPGCRLVGDVLTGGSGADNMPLGAPQHGAGQVKRR